MIKDIEYRILQMLVETGDFLTIKQISNKVNISERTVRYAIDNINYILKRNNMPIIKKKYGEGIKIDLTKNQIDVLATKESIYRNYLGFENKYRLILYLLKSHYSRTLQEISNFLGVSRSTTSKYLDEIEGYLREKGVQLVRRRNKGIYIVGRELQKRRIIYDIILHSYDYSRIHGLLQPETIYDLMIWNYFYGIDIKHIWELLIDTLKAINISVSDMAFYNIIINTCIMIKRIQQDFIADIEYEKMDYISETFEYDEAKNYCNELSKRYNIIIPKTEIIWISMHFLGANPIKFLEDDIFSNIKERHKLVNSIEKMVSQFEKEVDIALENKDEIINGLFVHLMPAINRAKYSIKIKNSYKEDIKNSYNEFYTITANLVRIINNEFNVELGSDEISYVCLHFVAAIEKMNKSYATKKRIIVVCSTGVGTSKLLANKLRNSYDDIEIIDILSYNQFISRNTFDIDYVISTVALKEANVPVIVVNPLINDEDKKQLSKIFSPKVKEKIINVESIINVVQKHCVIKDLTALKKDLKKNIIGEIQDEMLHIRDLLVCEAIITNVEVTDAKEAIKISGNALKQLGYVNDNYVKSLVNCLNKRGKNGPYIVISHGIALPHAKPEDGVYKTGFSMVILKEPVKFNHKKHDPVQVIISFATKNNQEHVKALEEITSFIMLRKNFKNLIQCKDSKEVILLLENFKEEGECSI
ncbi:BglG family transcription antiterminator [Clostridium tetani]|uniref:BglG family transcription antiterminator n=1 Tax=Clostridium tetani TaxID=1513 RepID=UPI0018F86F09|nr:BglG family transcription antiterminator [Clostridium tetani]